MLLLELGSFDRFKTPEAVTAYAGLDARTEQSGDSQKRPHISRRGSSRIRSALYMPALTAIRCNPVLQVFYQHLVEAGKPPQLAVVAVMRKLLILAWACGRRDGEPFSVDYETKRRATTVPPTSQTPAAPSVAVFDPAAPVSRRALRRNNKQRAGSTPQAI